MIKVNIWPNLFRIGKIEHDLTVSFYKALACETKLIRIPSIGVQSIALIFTLG